MKGERGLSGSEHWELRFCFQYLVRTSLMEGARGSVVVKALC
jgi:hypothetical protein